MIILSVEIPSRRIGKAKSLYKRAGKSLMKVAKDPVCRIGMVKSHRTSSSRIGHANKFGCVRLDCHSSEKPALETHVAEKGAVVLDGAGKLEALSGWEREGFAFCTSFTLYYRRTIRCLHMYGWECETENGSKDRHEKGVFGECEKGELGCIYMRSTNRCWRTIMKAIVVSVFHRLKSETSPVMRDQFPHSPWVINCEVRIFWFSPSVNSRNS